MGCLSGVIYLKNGLTDELDIYRVFHTGSESCPSVLKKDDFLKMAPTISFQILYYYRIRQYLKLFSYNIYVLFITFTFMYSSCIVISRVQPLKKLLLLSLKIREGPLV